MYTLQRDNVVKLTDSTVKRDRYISEGYHLVEDPVSQSEEHPAALPDEGAPTEAEQPEETPAGEAPAKGKVKPGDKRNS